MEFVFWSYILFLVLLLVRVHVVGRIRLKQIDTWTNYPTKDSKEKSDWFVRQVAQFETRSFGRMLFMLTKWTYEDFYGRGNGQD